MSANRYEVDLLNKVLNIDFGYKAAEILEIKVGGRKKYLLAQPGSTPTRPSPVELVDIFFRPPNLNFDTFAAL